MRYRHRVSVFSENGDFEGIFLLNESNEGRIAFRIRDGLTLTLPWENVFRAVFIPEEISKVVKTEERVSEQIPMFVGAQ